MVCGWPENVVRLIISLSNFQADLEVFCLTCAHPDCMFCNGLVNDADLSFFLSGDGIRQQFYAGTGELFTDNIVREMVRSPDKWSNSCCEEAWARPVEGRCASTFLIYSYLPLLTFFDHISECRRRPCIGASFWFFALGSNHSRHGCLRSSCVWLATVSLSLAQR